MTLYGYTKNTPSGTASTTMTPWARSCDVGNTIVLFVQHGVTGTTVVINDSTGQNPWTKVQSSGDLAATTQRVIDVWICTAKVAITSITGTASAATNWILSAEDLPGTWIVRDSNKYFGSGHTLTALTTVAGDALFMGAAYVASVAGTPQLGLTGWVYEGENNLSTTQFEQFKIAPTSSVTGSTSTSFGTNPTIGAVYLALAPTAPTMSGTTQFADSFTGANGAPPDTSKWTATLAGSPAGTAAIQSNALALTPGAVAYAGAVTSLWATGCPALPNTDWDIMVTIDPGNPILQHYMVLGMSTNGSVSGAQAPMPGNGYAVQLFPSSNGYNLNRIVSSSITNLMGANGAYTFAAGVPVTVRIQRIASTNTINFWIWNTGSAFPNTPTWTGTDSAPVTGTLKPLLSASNGASSTAVISKFDDFILGYTPSAAPTQGWFISDGTNWNHYVMYVSNGTVWIAAPASESA